MMDWIESEADAGSGSGTAFAASPAPLGASCSRTVDEILKPKGVAVIIEAKHGCMFTRGVDQPGISMVTRSWPGDFRFDPDLRHELQASIKDGQRRPV